WLASTTGDPGSRAAAVAASLAGGTTKAAVGLQPELRAVPDGRDGWRLQGRLGLLVGPADADDVVVGARGPDGERWFLLDGEEARLEPVPPAAGLDATRPLATGSVDAG